MTAFKTILVPVCDHASASASLDLAFRLAGEFAAHVTALHVRTDAAAAVPLMGEGMSGAMVEEMLSVAERHAAGRAADARAAFDAAIARHGIPLASAPPTQGATASWVDITGREEEEVARRGRLHDVVVTGRPIEHAETPSLLTLNAALMESGKPLLLAPPQPVDGLARRIAVAWNGSAEAGRAAAAAVPLMARAERVVILSMAEDDRTIAAPAGELAAFLAWHGITAECKVIAAGSQAGHALLDECRLQGADLLVMGAYTHSRLRQLILGGVTRHVLNHAELPCLLSH